MKIFRSRFFIVLFAILFTPVFSAFAQESPEVTINEVVADYPFAIHFELFATHSVEIESVTLVYGLNGRSCQQSSIRQQVATPESKTAFAFWAWDLFESGALPPGITVWWEWEILDVEGNLFTIERREQLIEDTNHDWRSARSGDVSVYWYIGDNSFGQTLLREATDSLERLNTELGLPAIEPVALWFYPTASDVRQVIFDVPEWTGGVAFPEYNVTVLGVGPGELDWASRIVPHELTHLVEGMLTFNCRGTRLPTWLSEGLARYGEGELAPSDVTQVDLALQNGRLPPLRSLANGFSAFSDSASEAYAQSGRVVKYLIDTHGAEQMNELLLAIQSGQTIDDALMAVYGLDTSGVDAAWRTAVGYAATPTSEADAVLLDATPTQIATVALGGVPLLDTPTPLPSETPTPTDTPPPTATVTETPPATATAVPQEVAQAGTPTPDDEEDDPVTGQDATTLSWIWWSGGVTGLLLITALFLRSRQKRDS